MGAVREALLDVVEQALDAYLDRALPRLTGTDPALEPLAERLRAFLRQGKRLRPLFLLLGHRAAGGIPDAAVAGPAVAVELLHACALLHDDVIDAAELRRGAPAVHVALADWHRAQAWQGDSERFGEAAAILLGDLAHAHADEAFLDADVPPHLLLDGLRAFVLLREEVMAGQYLDLQAAAGAVTDPEVLAERAVRVARLKSGRYTVMRPLQIGARLAGAGAELLDALAAVGDPLGLAFQLSDDLLGVFGDARHTGKPVGADLGEGKRTLLLAETLRRLGEADREAVLERLGDGRLDADRVAQLTRLVEETGARRAIEELVATSVAEARAALAVAPVDEDTRGELDALAASIVGRRD